MIYFMRCATSENVKIGFTDRDPKVRIKEFGLPKPELLATCPGDRRTEREFFHRFRRWRISPTSEWFMPGPELLGFIRGDVDEYNIPGSVDRALGKVGRVLGLITFLLTLTGCTVFDVQMAGWNLWNWAVTDWDWTSFCCVPLAVFWIFALLVGGIANGLGYEPEEKEETLEEIQAKLLTGDLRNLTVIRTLDDKESGGMGPVLLLGLRWDSRKLVTSVDALGYPKTYEDRFFPLAVLIVNENRFIDLRAGTSAVDEEREHNERIMRALKATGSWPTSMLNNDQTDVEDVIIGGD